MLWRKIKQGMETGSTEERRSLNRMVRESLPGNEPCCYMRKSMRGREDKCKGPEAGLCCVVLRTN